MLKVNAAVKATPKFQFGFRIQHGTPKQLHRVVSFALEAMERKEEEVSAFVGHPASIQ